MLTVSQALTEYPKLDKISMEKPTLLAEPNLKMLEYINLFMEIPKDVHNNCSKDQKLQNLCKVMIFPTTLNNRNKNLQKAQKHGLIAQVYATGCAVTHQ